MRVCRQHFIDIGTQADRGTPLHDSGHSAVVGLRRRGVFLGEFGAICCGGVSIGLGVRPVQGGRSARFECRTVLLFAVVQEGVEAGGRVAGHRYIVTCLGLIVTLLRVGQNVACLFFECSVSRLPGVSAGLTRIEYRFPVCRDSLLVAVSRRRVRTVVVFTLMTFGAPARRFHMILFHRTPRHDARVDVTRSNCLSGPQLMV
jgi:hypothetical protein